MERMLADLKSTHAVTTRQVRRSQFAGLTPRLLSHEAPHLLTMPLRDFATAREMSASTRQLEAVPMISGEAAVWTALMEGAGITTGSRTLGGQLTTEVGMTIATEPRMDMTTSVDMMPGHGSLLRRSTPLWPRPPQSPARRPAPARRPPL